MITFQQIIERLNHFWEKRGCVIHLGHDLETGAGTFNPATFMRCLGPEPYKAAYIEPSRRPSDGRYGENPNRMQLFHQYQVILKPSPPDLQKLYLDSLKAIGLNLSEHDIRFVHDDWESPTLGAYGLGWEVWVDGMEISQFTYFQGFASLPLKPISGELTYGLERLAMFIQNVDNIFDIHWNDALTLRDISHRNEVEWSAYNFTFASTDMWLKHFDDYEKEAKRLVAANLPIPAYDFVIKASHAFNILDARSAISVTERTGYIARIRDLSRLIAVEYLASREKQGFPLLKETPAAKPVKLLKISTKFNAHARHDFLLEIGSEELPATFVPIGMRNLQRGVETLLKNEGLSFDGVTAYGTPRRLAVKVSNLSAGTSDKVIKKRGPPVGAAYDASGKLTPQGEGFLRSIGAKEAETQDGYLYASVKQTGKSTAAILAAALPKLILDLEFPKKMRWGNLDISYARPLHWIVALFGDKIVPFQVGNIASNRFSFGHAQLCPKKCSFKEAKEYLSVLRDYHVVADIAERKDSILTQLQEIEKSVDGKALEKEKVLVQVLYLAEWPQLTYANFSDNFLKVPSEVLISEMVEHQKYFPLADNQGRLKNLFVITADNTPNDTIRRGNQKVLSARLFDGVFLYEQDLKTPLEELNQKLKVMTFQKDLGSMLDKVMRLTAHCQILNRHLPIADDKRLLRAALLCKADLASHLVGEFPELQGTIGKYYAAAQREEREVAEAIEEHWMPRFEGAPLPKTPAGMLLSLADKIDNLLGYYSVGLKPSSSHDPYALRRQAIGLIKILIHEKLSLNLKAVLEECQTKKSPELVDEILRFITARAKSVFEEHGFKKDEIEAAIQGLCTDPYDQFRKVEALHDFRNSDKFGKLHEVYKRAKGQLEKRAPATFHEQLATEPSERALVKALAVIEKEWTATLADRDYKKAFSLIASLQPLLADLFDNVKILADDPTLQENRIALLQKVFGLFKQLLDFGQIQ